MLLGRKRPCTSRFNCFRGLVVVVVRLVDLDRNELREDTEEERDDDGALFLPFKKRPVTVLRRREESEDLDPLELPLFFPLSDRVLRLFFGPIKLARDLDPDRDVAFEERDLEEPLELDVVLRFPRFLPLSERVFRRSLGPMKPFIYLPLASAYDRKYPPAARALRVDRSTCKVPSIPGPITRFCRVRLRCVRTAGPL